jgi:phosphoenolpyruvate carboxykinase (GTP)
MADYFRHWLFMGLRMKNQPRIFHVNWFKTDKIGKFLWPGYGENLRVIEWILARCRGETQAMETPIGFIPTPESFDLSGLDISSETINPLLSIDREAWIEELKGHKEFFIKFGKRLPLELWQQYQALCKRFGTDDEIPLT